MASQRSDNSPGTDDSPQIVPEHPLTPLERQFLRRYRWIRLQALLGTWFWIVLIGSWVVFPAVVVLDLIIRNPSIESIASGGVILGLLIALSSAWVPGILQLVRVRVRVPVRKLMIAAELDGTLALLKHRTDDSENLWLLDNRLIEIPSHWERHLLDSRDECGQFPSMHLRVVRLPDTSGRILRFPVATRVARSDILFADAHYLLMGMDQHTIEAECRRGLPNIRAQRMFLRSGFKLLILAAFLGFGVQVVQALDPPASDVSVAPAAAATDAASRPQPTQPAMPTPAPASRIDAPDWIGLSALWLRLGGYAALLLALLCFASYRDATRKLRASAP